MISSLARLRTAHSRLTAREDRELRRAARLLRVRRSEFVRRAIARLVAETLDDKKTEKGEAA